MKTLKNIIIRAETKLNEFRTPLCPNDITKLIEKGFNIFVEKSEDRCFKDSEYLENGAKLIEKGSWINFKGTESIIIGLKELENCNELDNHTHLYFSHFFKNNSSEIKFFKETNSFIYDYEYLTDENNKRLIAFGYYAGYIGALLGLLFYTDEIILPLKTWVSEPEWKNKTYLKIALIGPYGNCGMGVQSLLAKYMNYIECDLFPRYRSKDNLENYDIIFNCIFLDKYVEPFISKKDIDKFNKKTIIVDISCDPTHPYNPLSIYSSMGTWKLHV